MKMKKWITVQGDEETLTPDERRRNDDLVANQAAGEALFRRERLRKSMFADADEEEVDPVEVDEAEVDPVEVDEEEVDPVEVDEVQS